MDNIRQPQGGKEILRAPKARAAKFDQNVAKITEFWCFARGSPLPKIRTTVRQPREGGGRKQIRKDVFYGWRLTLKIII